MVVKATNACFSDMVRVTGFLVPRREAVVAVEQEGFRVIEVLVRDGDQVTENQELVRLAARRPRASRPAAHRTRRPRSRPGMVTLRAPAAGRIIHSTARAGAFASPQLGPLFRIAIDNEIELDAEVPNVHVLKLTPGVTARIIIDGGPEVTGASASSHRKSIAAPSLARHDLPCRAIRRSRSACSRAPPSTPIAAAASRSRSRR